MKRFFRTAVFLASVVCCCGCGRKGEFDGTGSRQYADIAMGTVIRQSIYAPERTADTFIKTAQVYLEHLERDFLSWRLDTSEVYRINASAGSEEGCALSEEMAELLYSCMKLHRDSAGAFDVTLGAAVRLWDIDGWAAGREGEVFSPPSDGAVEEALTFCGGEQINLVRGAESRLFMPEGMRLDLGAVGKGFALAGIGELLKEQEEIGGAVISLGGSILTYGQKPDGSPWRVSIVDPFDTADSVGILTLRGQWCISTSGDYERYAEAGGVRYHHILDPATGYPADSGVRGVTVLSGDGLVSDALSTACFILGPEQGLALAAEYGAEVLFVMADGEIVMSLGLESYVEVGR